MRKKDDEKEQRIKEAVASLMLEEGWSGTSISKIARKAEVSPATVYTYSTARKICCSASTGNTPNTYLNT